ncbi:MULTISPECIES: tRNA (cytidine(34)-2'-O)-methyltransferase [Kocuria]|uniref:tRNA (cytidine(34)-2'-O)-methyltransferase n=1 Tax=Kocuria TaxID=57493 RepID=UPI00066115FF|nr:MULTISPECIES: tRNA (cytidine(34)-2'-O)-methyltransferase [Kocuria]MCT1367534.1 tRNA (cytidine(34)-2'-O)-methyltransferase [Rothia sp. p3-SID1597]RUQ22330.1 tRNA (cytidine(34)-2'-O)-methyltransferase [Kocuria sp. HSID16901]
MFNILFYTPEIPGNTGNAIRLAAVTGAHLHLVEPLGFSFEDAHLRRAGLDYHDLAVMTVHPSFDAATQALGDSRLIAFSTTGTRNFGEVDYKPGDTLVFGPESVGLPDEIQHDDRIDELVRIPMLPGRRSLNLANSASIAVYEAWRQNDFGGVL